MPQVITEFSASCCSRKHVFVFHFSLCLPARLRPPNSDFPILSFRSRALTRVSLQWRGRFLCRGIRRYHNVALGPGDGEIPNITFLGENTWEKDVRTQVFNWDDIVRCLLFRDWSTKRCTYGFPYTLPVISGAPFLLYIGLHPTCITLKQCFRMEHRQVALMLLVSIRYLQIARFGDKSRPSH